MLEQSQNFEISAQDMTVIEDALFTQEKILSVQSRAGGHEAETRLNELRQVLRRMRRQKTYEPKPYAAANFAWVFGFFKGSRC